MMRLVPATFFVLFLAPGLPRAEIETSGTVSDMLAAFGKKTFRWDPDVRPGLEALTTAVVTATSHVGPKDNTREIMKWHDDVWFYPGATMLHIYHMDHMNFNDEALPKIVEYVHNYPRALEQPNLSGDTPLDLYAKSLFLVTRFQRLVDVAFASKRDDPDPFWRRIRHSFPTLLPRFVQQLRKLWEVLKPHVSSAALKKSKQKAKDAFRYRYHIPSRPMPHAPMWRIAMLIVVEKNRGPVHEDYTQNMNSVAREVQALYRDKLSIDLEYTIEEVDYLTLTKPSDLGDHRINRGLQYVVDHYRERTDFDLVHLNMASIGMDSEGKTIGGIGLPKSFASVSVRDPPFNPAALMAHELLHNMGVPHPESVALGDLWTYWWERPAARSPMRPKPVMSYRRREKHSWDLVFVERSALAVHHYLRHDWVINMADRQDGAAIRRFAKTKGAEFVSREVRRKAKARWGANGLPPQRRWNVPLWLYRFAAILGKGVVRDPKGDPGALDELLAVPVSSERYFMDRESGTDNHYDSSESDLNPGQGKSNPGQGKSKSFNFVPLIVALVILVLVLAGVGVWYYRRCKRKQSAASAMAQQPMSLAGTGRVAPQAPLAPHLPGICAFQPMASGNIGENRV